VAGILLTMGGRPNVNVMEFVVDTEEEIQYLPTTNRSGIESFKGDANFDFCAPLGSTCIVGNKNSYLKIYMLFSFGWKEM